MTKKTKARSEIVHRLQCADYSNKTINLVALELKAN